MYSCLVIPHWVSTHMGNLYTAHVRACVHPSVRASVEHRISEMAGWIHLKVNSRITYISGVMPVFSDFEKNENCRFYGRFFLSVSDLILGNGWMDSSDILQQVNQYS